MTPKSRFSILLFTLAACVAAALVPARDARCEEPSRDAIIKELKEAQDSARIQAIRSAFKKGAADAELVAALCEALKDPLTDARRAAAGALEKFGAAGRAAVPALIEAAADTDFATRAAILSALGTLAPPGKTALPVLTAALNDPSPQLRVVAVEALHRHGAAAADALPALIAMALQEKHPDVINALAASLPECQPVPPELAPFFAAALKGPVALRGKAVEALNKIGAKAVPAMLAQLSSDFVYSRREAAAFLERFPKDSKVAVPQLVLALKDSDPAVRKSSAAALAAMGPDVLPAMPDLLALLNDADGLRRAAAADVLEALGPAASDAVPALLAMMQDKVHASRTSAGKALAKMGPKGLDGLLALLAHPRDDVRTSVAQALGLCGDAALPGLAAALKSGNPDTVAAALAALNLNGGVRGPTLPPLIALLNGKPSTTRSLATAALAKCGVQAVPPLIEALQNSADATPEFRAALTDVLGRLGAPAVAPLLEYAANAQKMCRDARAEKTAGPAPMEIERAKACGQSAALYSSLEALGKIGAPAVDAVPLLMEMLVTFPAPAEPVKPVKNQTPVVPPYAKLDAAVLQALAGIGPRAEAALPMLFELLKDGESTVRGEASRAIARVATGKERLPPLGEIVERCDTGSVARALGVFQDAGLEALLVEFNAPSQPLRVRVASVFYNLAPAAAFPFLAAALKNDDPLIRSGAAMALAEMRRVHKKTAPGAPAAPVPAYMDAVLAALRDAVKDSDPDVRVLAAYAYNKAIDPDDGGIVERIASGIAQCAADNRARGLTALEFYNLEKAGRKAAPALPVLIRLAGVDNGANVPPARVLIQQIGVTKEDVPVLVDALKDKNNTTRRAALKMIEALGPEARDGVPGLIEALGDADDKQFSKGIEAALLAIGPDAVPPLVEALKNTGLKKRFGVAQALAQMNLDNEWLRKIGDLILEERPETRASALAVLSTTVERAKYALPHVRELLADTEKTTTRASQELFAVLGAEAAPALVDALKDHMPQIRARAAAALKPRGTSAPPPEALKPLLTLLGDDNPEVKAAALQTLSVYQGNAAEIMPGLGAAIKDESTQMRRAVLAYLKLHGAEAPDAAVEVLAVALKDATARMRLDAIDTLKELGPKPPGVSRLLFETLGDSEHRVRAAAAAALEALGLAHDPDKKMPINEMFALDGVEQYAQAQEEHFIKFFDGQKVHFYASELKELADLPKAMIDADGALNAPAPYNGFMFKMLEGQSAAAPGGAKKYRVDGKMSQGHALLASPAEYGTTGRFTFIVADDGTIYKKDLGPETARVCGAMRELNPDDTWLKLKVKPKNEEPVRFHPNETEGEEMEF